METLIREDFFDKDFQTISMNECSRFVYDKKNQQQRLVNTSPFTVAAVHWGSIYRALEKRVQKNDCHYGVQVTQVKNNIDHVELTLNDLQRVKFDYVIFADGYNSIGRRTVYPDLKPDFANYIAWRGLVQMEKITIEKYLGYVYQPNGYYYLYEKGHLLLYPIPNINDADSKNYLINWLVYEKVDHTHPLFKDDMTLAEKNVTPGPMTTTYLNYLHKLAQQYFPEFPCELILETKQPFTQAIYDILLPNYVKNHICLIGDASAVLRPHVGAGATKALQNALSLGEHLKEHPHIEAALSAWNESQNAIATQLYHLGRDLGKLIVTDVPDCQTLDKKKMDELWQQVVVKYNWYIVKK